MNKIYCERNEMQLEIISVAQVFLEENDTRLNRAVTLFQPIIQTLDR